MTKQNQTLRRSLGFKQALALVIGTVIGTGVFLKTAIMSVQLGSPYWVLAAFAAAGLLSFCGALCYAELGSLFPQAGGEYVFLREAYGDVIAFLFGWMRFWIGTPGSIAAYGVGAATFLSGILPLGAGIGRSFVALGLIWFFSLLNCLSVAFGGRVQALLTDLKIVMILGLAGAIFGFGHGGTWEHFQFTPAISPGFSAFGAAMIAALWAFDGWSNMPIVAGEIVEPGRVIPKALAIGMALIFLLYGLANLAYFYALPFSEVVQSYSKFHPEALPVATRAAQITFGSFAVTLLSVAFVISALGAMNGSILTGARVPYAMAKDGLFFRQLGHLSPKSSVPVPSILVQGLVASALAVSGSFDQLTDLVVFAAWIFYALTTGAVLVLRKKRAQAVRPFRVPGYPFLPVVFIFVSVTLLINTLLTTPRESGAGLLLILTGLPVYYWFRSQSRSRT